MENDFEAGVPFICNLPDGVVYDIIQNTPFVSWGCFVMSCKASYDQFARNERLAGFLYTKISLGPSCRILSIALSKTCDPSSILSGLSKYLRHTVFLEIERQKSFNDYCLRTVHGFCPLVTSLTLTSCPMIRGGLGLTPSGQVPINFVPGQAQQRTKISGQPSSSHAEAAPSLPESTTSTPAPDSSKPESSEVILAHEETVLQEGRPPSAIALWVRQLKTLLITACGLKDAEFGRLAPLMGGIERLALKSSLIQTALPAILSHANKVKHLYLDGSWKLRTTDFEQAAQLLPAGLETLSLKSCEHVSDLALSRMLARCGSTLKTLNIKFNIHITHHGLEAIRMLCSTGNLKYIAFANISPAITTDMWGLHAPNWTNVEYLDISVNPGVTDETIKTLSCCPSVTNLNLRSTSITDESIAMIARFMPKLLYIDVSGCLSLKSLPDLWLLPDLCRISCPECPALSPSLLYPQFEMVGQNLKFVTKYDLSFAPIDDRCVVSLVQNAFWLAHLSVIACDQLTDVAIQAVYELLANPRHTASFFSLGVCRTPKVSDGMLRKLKLRFASKSLKTMEHIEHNGLVPLPLSQRLNPESVATSSSSPRASSSAASNMTSGPTVTVSPRSKQWDLPEKIRNLSEDSITISCARGGKCQTKFICQCAQFATPRARVTSLGTASLNNQL
jgi:hypothetical protein